MGCILSTKTDTRRRRRHDQPTTTTTTTTSAASVVAVGTSPVTITRSPGDPLEWPPWLLAFAGKALAGLTPRRADSFKKLSKIGSGTYSNVYKAIEVDTGRVVAIKKVRFEAEEKESIRFMAREIELLRRLGDHPNIVKFEGVVVSRVSQALYLVFEYMEHDLAGLAAAPGTNFSEAQIKCYMKQLFTGLEHCHSHGVLHRDIKGSNLLINNEGILKIADFGLAASFDPAGKQAMTSRVVTLWYRAPELLLGSTHYGVGIDLWSAGCILAELLTGKPILPGRTEVEQLHRIFKLCGSPSDKYWKKWRLPHAAIVRPQQPYERSIADIFKEYPSSSVSLIDKLLSIDPLDRGTAADALKSDFFTTNPHACEPSSLPKYPPSKEMDAKLREEKFRRQKELDKSGNKRGTFRKQRAPHYRQSKAVPVPEANAELPVNLHRQMFHVNGTSKSEKFPPPHQDGGVGVKLDNLNGVSLSFVANDASFTSEDFEAKMGKSRKVSHDSHNLMKSLMLDIARSGRLHMKGNPKELKVSSEAK
ncbi:Kinase superfamily protein [Rhynchospora pubera]|uniref:[RNA-polymerase]-subunit kinase n=1 Tax=Rhynchospora pubera TaxID=906938 RepID=A0AAV8FNZ6_9POAL|nr:Kinase superfamily protein [Rhynchospora pubera]